MVRRLSAILAADMVGYSRLMEADEVGTLERQKAHRRELIDPAFQKFHGRIVKEMGDGVLVEFPSVVEAVQCAVEIQRKMPEREARFPEDLRIAYRIGINLGDIIVEENDIYGDGVNIAARLEALADPGAICISGTVFDHLKARIDVDYEPLGEINVKNIEWPVRAYKVLEKGKQKEHGLRRSARRNGPVIWGLVIFIGFLIGGSFLGSDLITGLVEDKASAVVQKGPSIAVLPFENLSKYQDQDYFADGLAEDVITDLSKISGLFVIARNTSFQYRGVQRKVVDVGLELGVRYVLKGSVRRSEDRIRINVQLVDAKSGGQLWAERYDGNATDIFKLQDRVTGQILDALQPKLSNEEQRAVRLRETDNPEAYDAYLRGLRLIAERRRLDVERNKAAQSAFKKAIRLDSRYSSAYAGLGWAKWLRVEQIDVFDQRSRLEAFELARNSIAINDNALARRILAREHLSILNYWIETTKNIRQAVAELERAHALQPNDPDVLVDLALALNFAGQPARAIDLSRKAMERNPNHPDWYFAASGIAHLLSGNPERAIPDLEKWVNSDRIYNVPYLFLASAQGLAGKTSIANSMLHQFEKFSNTISSGHTSETGPFEIRSTTYAVKRRWPMGPKEEQVFIGGLKAAGMRDLES
jgi:TolB-like protein/class 3 adenylate cyclase